MKYEVLQNAIVFRNVFDDLTGFVDNQTEKTHMSSENETFGTREIVIVVAIIIFVISSLLQMLTSIFHCYIKYNKHLTFKAKFGDTSSTSSASPVRDDLIHEPTTPPQAEP